jgi:hypothetical protein
MGLFKKMLHFLYEINNKYDYSYRYLNLVKQNYKRKKAYAFGMFVREIRGQKTIIAK